MKWSVAARSIARGEPPAKLTLELCTEDLFLEEIRHQSYRGDSLLHVAAASFDVATAKKLVKLGADVRARNRRGAEPLHYAADGAAGTSKSQAAMVKFLVASGADANALDKSGVAPLHRAVRSRCTSAVEALLAAGADATLKNGSGSTPADLAHVNSGKSGSGSAEAHAEQQKIIALFESLS
ncbi:MAG: ankyrin repeat domain-containing protein [Archangium sp.]